MATEPGQSWETWHKRFGHISYSGLQKLLDLDLVEGFSVDTRTPKPNCVTCTEAKQTEEPFKKSVNRKTEPGELTHIDLWGKYDVQSINGNQYYLLFVDDSARYTTAEYLKQKSDATQKVIEYLVHLKTQGRAPKAIRIDRGKEFVNETLQSWCRQQGIEIQMTAPYSPSQNGVAERMNRTLVELARAMIKGQQLPEFLWELAVAHAVYLRNRSYTSPLKWKTPYEIWVKKKPSVSHLREFGAPVWVLLQGQHKQRKMKPKSKRQAYVGYDDGSKSVQYYNAETRKILTSRNYRFLTLPEKESPPEEIEVAPDTPREGERKASAQPMGTKGDSLKRKRPAEEEPLDLDSPRKTRGRRINYRYLHDPFPDEEEEDEESPSTTAEQIYAAFAETPVGGEDPKTLKEAKKSPDWPEWERAVREELDQLQKMGTWLLVDAPDDVIPISNKWVFLKKFGKLGELLKYKARLVAKGCAQRPGFDYLETFSPVVRLETIRAILALAAIKGLKIQQMDVKGAYLNGTLNEKVYMRQPDGFDDGTGRVCLLIKTLYGLKQSGREWYKELSAKLKKRGFECLRSDPCAFVR
jgi:hypothetical protein